MKKAIYFNDKERDLARRICAWVCFKARERADRVFETDMDKIACYWLNDEVRALGAKFSDGKTSEKKTNG